MAKKRFNGSQRLDADDSPSDTLDSQGRPWADYLEVLDTISPWRVLGFAVIAFLVLVPLVFLVKRDDLASVSASQALENGHYAKAAKLLQTAFGKKPEAIKVNLLLAECFVDTGEMAKAIEALDRIDDSTESPLPHQRQEAQALRVWVLLEEGEPEKARTLAMEVLRDQIEQGRANALMMRYYMERGEPEKGAPYYRRILDNERFADWAELYQSTMSKWLQNQNPAEVDALY